MRLYPSRVTRYLLVELLMPTVLGLVVYTFVLLMNHFFVVAEKALAKNLGFELTLRLFASAIPNLLVMSIPMSVLLGTLIGVGRLSADREWVALQAGGHGPGRLLRPVLIHGLLFSLVAGAVYSFAVPRASYTLRNLRGELLYASNLASDLKPRTFYTELSERVLFVDEIRAGSKGRMEGVLVVHKPPNDGATELLLAREGDLYPSPDRSGTLVLDLYDGVGHVYKSHTPDNYGYSKGFDKIRRVVPPAAYMQSLREPPAKVVTDLTPVELWQEYKVAVEERDKAHERASQVGKRGRRVNTFIADNRVARTTIELHQRLALPLACLVFALLGLPLGVTRVRTGKGAGFALSIFVLLIYWAVFTFGRNQAIAGRFPVVLGPWLGNIALIPWIIHGYWRLHRPPSRRPVTVVLGVIQRATRAVAGWLKKIKVPLRRRVTPAAPSSTDELQDGRGGRPSRFVFRIDQYIGKQFLRVLLFTMVSVYVIYALVDSKNLMESLLRTKQSPALILSYLKYLPPGVLHIILPISCLVAAVVAFSLLSKSSELTAIKNGGVSMLRATAPVLVLTMLFCVLQFLVQDRIAPGANRAKEEIKDQIMGRAPRSYGPSSGGRWSLGPGGQRIYHYQLYDAEREEFQGLTVFTVDRTVPRITAHRFCDRARWSNGRWETRDGWIRTFPGDGTTSYREVTDVESLIMAPPGNFSSRQARFGSLGNLSEQTSLEELYDRIQDLRESGYDITQLRVAFHGKLSQSLSPLVMVLLGLPFAFKVGRRGSLYGVGVALVLVMIYWAVFAMFNALGMETVLEPWVAAWAPNALFGLLGVSLLLYIRS